MILSNIAGKSICLLLLEGGYLDFQVGFITT